MSHPTTLYEFLSELIKSNPFWGVFGGVVGVILGFFLGEGTRMVRHWIRIRRLKLLLRAELKAVLKQIPYKKDIVGQILEALGNERYIPGLSVRVITIGYRQHIVELYEHFSVLERNCLHVIYEHLDVSEKMLSSFEQDFTTALSQRVIGNPFNAFKDRFMDIRESYSTVEDLIKSYLQGKPIDVFA